MIASTPKDRQRHIRMGDKNETETETYAETETQADTESERPGD